VPTLDGRTLTLRMADVIKPTTVRRIPNEGLPFPKEPTKRGELIVEFDIEFPDSLPSKVREKLGEMLP
jgi:DnaJ-class molecular chaperone